MKRTLLILLAIVLCLPLFSGCGGTGAKFDLSYQVEKTEYTRGDVINITATVKNISGRSYRYIGCSSADFFPAAELYWTSDSGEWGGKIEHDAIMMPTDVVSKKVKNGETGSIVYSFFIPDAAVYADYSLRLSFGGDSKEFPDILKILEIPDR